jgi:hypothetical protein
LFGSLFVRRRAQGRAIAYAPREFELEQATRTARDSASAARPNS